MIRNNVALLMLIFTVLWSISTTIVQWLIARGRAAKGELADLRNELGGKADRVKVERMDAKLIEHDRRIQKTEHDVEHMPSLDLFHQLAIDLTEMRGEIRTMAVTLKSNTEMTRRIDEYLLEKVR